MLFLSLKELSMPSILAAFRVIHLVDGYEFRLASFHYDMENYFRKARALLKHPLMLTWKGRLQKEPLRKVLKLSPDFIDVDYRIEDNLYEELVKEFPNVKWVLSYHNFDGTDKNLHDRLMLMKQKKADYYKMALFANSAIDALSICLFAKNLEDKNVTTVAMGSKGDWSRVLMGHFGSIFSYTCLSNQSTAAGQIALEELCDVYHYHAIKKTTALYGLIGSPVWQSYSHITHNEIMQRHHLHAVYVKLLIEEGEIKQALPIIEELGFQGLSVTAPLKALVAPCKIVNTLLFGKEPINTDGLAVLQLLKEKIDLYQAKVLIIGAGGAASGIAHSLKAAGVDLYVFNRGTKRAAAFMEEFDAKAHVQHSFYDVVIQAGTEFDPHLCHFTCEQVALEVISNPITTPFIESLKGSKCHIIYGYQMFALQAALQFEYWFKNKVPEAQQIYVEIEQLFASSIAHSKTHAQSLPINSQSINNK